MRPVSGRKPFAGSSEVMRHCSAAPVTVISSWRRPRSSQRLPRGDPDLRGDQVDVGDLLGDGVLDLDPGVHLNEEIARHVPRGLQQELDGPGVDVADVPGEGHRVGADRLPHIGIQPDRGCDLDHLLMPALHRAVPLEQVDGAVRVAGRGRVVGQDLHLDVAGMDDGAFQEDGRVAEGGFGLPHGHRQRFRQRGRLVHPAHPAAAAAGDGLDEQRETDVLGGGDQRPDVARGLAGRRAPESRRRWRR